MYELCLLVRWRINNGTGNILFHEEKKREWERETHGQKCIHPVELVKVRHSPVKAVQVYTIRFY